jgi:hypothetical protein
MTSFKNNRCLRTNFAAFRSYQHRAAVMIGSGSEDGSGPDVVKCYSRDHYKNGDVTANTRITISFDAVEMGTFDHFTQPNYRDHRRLTLKQLINSKDRFSVKARSILAEYGIGKKELQKMLDSKDVREMAALHEVGRLAVRDARSSVDSSLRRDAIDRLKKIGGHLAFAAISERAVYDLNPKNSMHALEALLYFKPSQAMPKLYERAMHEKNPKVRAKAVEVLSKFEKDALPYLKDIRSWAKFRGSEFGSKEIADQIDKIFEHRTTMKGEKFYTKEDIKDAPRLASLPRDMNPCPKGPWNCKPKIK